ncbi:PfkB family carbohydrate kinase [bacterium]|nr:PfkB family carbohydrate kinase [bacterium]
MKKVFVLGGVSYNLIVYLSSFPEPRPQTIFARDFHETIGETAAGKALNLVKLGFDVTLHSLIGNDESGWKIENILQKQGIHFFHDPDPKGTERDINLMDPNGGRISIFLPTTTYEPNVDSKRIEAAISENDLIVMNISNYCRYLIPLVRKHRKEIWCDIHDYNRNNPYHQDFIEAADYIFMSSDQMPDYRSFLEELIQNGKKLAVCTHGAEGSTALTSDHQWFETPIIKDYQRIDTNGAGDAFFAGFMYAYSRGYSVKESLQMGTVVSGLCITSRELAFPDLSAELAEVEFQKHYRGHSNSVEN